MALWDFCPSRYYNLSLIYRCGVSFTAAVFLKLETEYKEPLFCSGLLFKHQQLYPTGLLSPQFVLQIWWGGLLRNSFPKTALLALLFAATLTIKEWVKYQWSFNFSPNLMILSDLHGGLLAEDSEPPVTSQKSFVKLSHSNRRSFQPAGAWKRDSHSSIEKRPNAQGS